MGSCIVEKTLIDSRSKYFRFSYSQNEVVDFVISEALFAEFLYDDKKELFEKQIDDAVKEIVSSASIEPKAQAFSFELEERSGNLRQSDFQVFKCDDPCGAPKFFGVYVHRSQFYSAAEKSNIIATEGFLRDTVDILPAVFYAKDVNGRFLLVNETFRNLFAMKNEDIIGKSNHEVFPQEVADVFRKNDLEIINKKAVLESLEEAFDSEGNVHHFQSFKFPYTHDNNEVFATGGISLDITELVQSQKQLNASLETLAMNNKVLDIAHSDLPKNEKFQEVIDVLRELDWFQDDFAVSLYMLESETKADMVAAYSPDDQMTDYWGLRDLFVELATTADDDLLTTKEFEKDGVYYFGVQLKTEKQHHGCLFFRTNKEYKFDEHHRFYLKAYSRAIVDLIVKEQTRQEMDNQKKIMLHNAKLASIGELAAGIGHEINNPLAILKGYLETFERRKSESDFTSEEEDKYFNKIKTAANRIANIVKSLRTFSRIDDDENEEFDLNEAVEESVGMVSEIFSKEGIEIHYKSSCNESECMISGNRGRLLQVFMNLLTNARDATENLEEKKINVVVEKQISSVLVRVSDNGTGIKEEIIDKVFDPFFTTKDVSKGTGIGLSLVYNIVSEHGGKIEVKNLEEGCQFQVELPLASD